MPNYHFEVDYTDSQKKLIADILNHSIEGQYAVPYTEQNLEDVSALVSSTVAYQDGDFKGAFNLVSSYAALEDVGVPGKQGQIRIVTDLANGFVASALVMLAKEYL